jgi:TonB family protein
VIAEHRDEVRYCYERELRKSRTLAGTVAVKFIVAPSGEVRSSEVAQSSVHNAALEECVAARVGTWTFPEPRGGGAVVATYPFMFKSAEGEREAACDASSAPSSERRCGSLDKQLIRQVVLENLGEIRDCYEREVKSSPGLAGTVAVKLTIGPTGAVTLSEVARSTVDNAALELCVASRIRTWTFPKPSGDGPVTVTYPFNFEPGTAGSAQEENWTPHARPVSVLMDPETTTHGFSPAPSR